MQATMTLLERALSVHTPAEWNKLLGLSKNALYVAKSTGRLTPVVAGGLALELGESPEKWITVAVLEGEKASPAKDKLLKRLEKTAML